MYQIFQPTFPSYRVVEGGFSACVSGINALTLNFCCRDLVPGDHEFVESSYSYTMEWRDKLIDSSLFYTISGHHNPK
jgi:hypothetical protein